MRILMISTSGLNKNGIGNSILSFCKFLDNKNYKVDLLDVKNEHTDIASITTKLGIDLKSIVNRRKVLLYFIALVKLIRAERYDIVHVHGSSSIITIELFAAFLGGCKRRIAHGHSTSCNHKIIHKILRPILNTISSDRLACGQLAGDWVFGNGNFKILRNGIETEKFKYNENQRNKYRNKYVLNNQLVFGHVGNFNEVKNQIYVVEIFNEFLKKEQNSVLVFMGDGVPHIDIVKNRVKELGIIEKVLFLGSVDNVYQVQQAIDIMLLPSLYEGLPNVVIEWQIGGIPSIISDVITDECIICDFIYKESIHCDVDYWLRHIDMIRVKQVNRKKELSEIGLNRAILSGYSIENATKELMNIYDSK